MSNKSLLAWSMFIAILVWVGSCKPKNSDVVTPQEEDSTVIIARSCILLEERVNDALYRAYEYDSTRRLMRVYEYSADITLNRLVKRYTFVYDAKDSTKIIRFHETNLAVRDQSYIYELDYNDDGTYKYIRPYKIYNSGARPIDTINVFYDDNKRVSEMQAASIFHYVWDYDSAGNVKKWSIRRPEQTTDSLLAEYTEYDNKVNLFQFSKGVQLLNLLQGTPSSHHNPLTYNILGQNVSSSYTYNAKGLPTEAITSYQNLGDTLRTIFKHSYQLDCK